jgi:hypothetical protein
MPPQPYDELWRKIVEIHNHTKVHLIYCEERGIDHNTFIQPRNELCNALEHIVRAKCNELGMGESGKVAADNYERDSLDKALGHEYRAFFDVCDWLSIILREEIQNALGAYTPEVIQKVIPDYYSGIRPQLDGIPLQIAEIRAKKDIKGDVLSEVREYDVILSQIKRFRAGISAKIPALEEVKKGEERKKLWIAIGFLCTALLGAILKGIWDWSHR